MQNGITTIEQAEAHIMPRTIQIETLVKELRVRSPVSYIHGGEERKGIELLIREMETTRKYLKEPILESGRRIDKKFNGFKKPLIAARAILDKKLSDYRLAEQEKADQKRRELERERRAEEERRAAELEAAAVAGESQEDSAWEEPPAMAPMPAPVPSRIPKVQGLSTSIRWKGEVTSLLELVRAVANGDAPIDLLQINQPELNRLAKALRGAMIIPGIRAVSAESFTQRS